VLTTAATTFAIRCPQCGRLETTSVSLFAFGGGRSVKVSCSCGAHKLTIGRKRGQLWLQVPCYLCDGLHFSYHKPDSFWDDSMKPIACSETDLQLGVFGPDKDVQVYARTGGSELDRLLEDAAFGEYFDHPEVMYRTLSFVHALAEEGKLTCVCGNHQISVDIYPERLELSCSECGQHKTVLAASEEDLESLEHVRHIEVGGDAPGRRKGHKK